MEWRLSIALAALTCMACEAATSSKRIGGAVSASEETGDSGADSDADGNGTDSNTDGSSNGSGADADAQDSVDGNSTGSTNAKLTADDCVDPDLTKLTAGVQLTLCDGTTGQGTLNLTNLTQANIKSGVTIGGVTGSYSGTSTAACTTEGQQNCLVSGSMKAASVTGLASKVLSGSSVAGISGNVTLPNESDVKDSVVYGVSGTSKTGTYAPDFPDASNVRTTDTVDGAAGTLANCSADGAQDCVNTGNYYAVDSSAVDDFDIRIGKTIGGIAGKLKANCRNAVDSAIYNYDGAVSGIGQGAPTTGVTADWWDSVDDGTAFATEVPTGWSNYYCNPTDDWEDVSIDGDASGGDGNCNAAQDDCQYLDKLSGLVWSEVQATGTNWDTGMAHCGDTMNSTGNSAGTGPFGGATGWRMPTQKEMQGAYLHGIKGLESTHFIAELDISFWVATAVSSNAGRAWVVNPGSGDMDNAAPKSSTLYHLTCVREN